MKYRAITALCLAGLLMVAGAQRSVAQNVQKPAFFHPTPGPVQVAKTAPEAHAPAADTTLRFYEIINRLFVQDLERDGDRVFRSVGLIFDAPFDGTIDRVDFELSDAGDSRGVAGTGKLRIKLIELPFIVTEPPFQPSVDSVDVDLSDLAARGFVSPGDFINQIDLTERAFDIVEDESYFLQLALVEESADAALTFIYDEGSNDSTDTRYFIPPDFGSRTLVFVDSLGAEVNDCSNVTTPCDDFLSGRNPIDTTFIHLNVLLELQLSRPPPPPPPPPATTALMQFVHNAPGLGMVDVYVGDSLVVNDIDFRQASRENNLAFVLTPGGEQPLAVVNAADADNRNPLFSKMINLAADRSHWAVAMGTLGQNFDVAIQPTSGEGGEGDKVNYFMIHGANGADAVDINILDETPTHAVVNTIADDLAFGGFTGPAALDAGDFNVEVSADDTQLDVFRLTVDAAGGFVGTVLLMTSGIVGGDPALALMTVDAQSNVGLPPVSTATEDLAVPERFALHGNFPNPFNPTTTIRFDLDAPAFTTLTVYNLLGQEVATLVAEPLTAGVYEMAFDASSLPSGPYLYRLTSGSLSQQRMLMLVK